VLFFLLSFRYSKPNEKVIAVLFDFLDLVNKNSATVNNPFSLYLERLIIPLYFGLKY
jgi:hypothetical protein